MPKAHPDIADDEGVIGEFLVLLFEDNLLNADSFKRFVIHEAEMIILFGVIAEFLDEFLFASIRASDGFCIDFVAEDHRGLIHFISPLLIKYLKVYFLLSFSKSRSIVLPFFLMSRTLLPTYFWHFSSSSFFFSS